VSKHWKPESDSARWLQVDGCVPPKKQPWPEGATAGLVLVAAACLAVGVVLYQVAGPRDVVDESAAVDWDAVQGLSGPDSAD